MSRVSHLHHLRGQEQEVQHLLRSAEDSEDVVSEMNFRTRLERIQSELVELERTDANVGEVQLLFDGQPVEGQKSIDARFATKALKLFQDIVSKLYASKSQVGNLGARGMVKGADNSALRITDLAYGSFGFVLEEGNSDQYNVVPTAVREALDEALGAFEHLTEIDEDEFLFDIDSIDPRIFSSLSEFFRHIHSSKATLKAASPKYTLNMPFDAIHRAHDRLSRSKIDFTTERWTGQLVGLSPLDRKFEFKLDDTIEIRSGKFGKEISQDYLERIEAEGVTLGARFLAEVEVAELRKPNGAISTTYTALSLEQLA